VSWTEKVIVTYMPYTMMSSILPVCGCLYVQRTPYIHIEHNKIIFNSEHG